MRVPKEAGTGAAKVRLSMPSVEGLEIVARDVEIPVRSVPAFVEDPK